MKFTKIVYVLLVLIFCKINPGLAQKKNIDSNAYLRWSSVGVAAINDNGKYAYYIIENEPTGHKTFVLQSTENSWKRSFKDINGQCFLNTQKRDYAIILNKRDSLMIISLGKSEVQPIRGVSSFSICPNGESDWIAYELKDSKGELILQNINTERKYAYNNVINKVMGDDGLTVILQTEKKVDGQILQELSWIDLSNGKRTLIWEGLKIESITLDTKHKQLAFTSENELFLYKMTKYKLSCLINRTTHLDSVLKLNGIKQFSHDGNRLFIELKEDDSSNPKFGAVEVWSYLDRKLQSMQQKEMGARTYAAAINLIDSKVTRLEQESEYLSFNLMEYATDTIGTIFREGMNRDGSGGTSELISSINGKRTPLKYPIEGLSFQGKYVICFDPEQHIYFSYDTRTGIYYNITKAFSGMLLEPNLDRGRIAGWLKNDEAVLFYDAYDIWKLDLSGQKAPVNLTNGYGRKHHLIFSIVYGGYDHYPINKNQKLILAAFNQMSKKQGFYSLELDKVEEPKLLSMGNYYYGPQEGVVATIDGTGGIVPIKAKYGDVYVLSRMSANKSTNYFSTKDFKTFSVLSNVHPERDYNWYTTELHSWTSLDGRTLQGVLYKPENFDPNKRYPVIFTYYEGKSNNLNIYIKPQILCGGCNIDIPTYISHGYLVFTPDIVYKVGDPMQGTYDAVISVAKYLGALPFVDSRKMGIQGCSWGGIQTNYLVTHTNLFAAACTASGIADWIANYGKLYGGFPNQGGGQFRMEKTVWEIPKAYIKNSPIFQLNKVTTPFLIMHTREDTACSFDDAIELFTGLRRLGKKSWLLAYSKGNHGVSGEEAKDFSIRMMQFFDHYLKDQPASVWMTRGIRASRRGIDSGLELDSVVKTPGRGLLTPEEQKVVDSLMTRKPILIELK